MPSKLLNATSAYQDSRGQWFNAAEPLATKPASSTYNCCRIVVPYAHYLLKAFVAANDVDLTGTLTVSLYEADDADAKIGTSITALTAGIVADSSGTAVIKEFTLLEADKRVTAGARMYWLVLLGNDANALWHRPQLVILVEPVTRSTL